MSHHHFEKNAERIPFSSGESMPVYRSNRNRYRESILTPQEFEQAICIDFEGFKDQAPALLGILCEDSFQQIVLSRDLQSTASNGSTSFEPLNSILRKLKRKAEEESRSIIAFSEHEVKYALRFGRVDLWPVFKNARIIAQRWRRNQLYADDRNVRSLKDYLSLVDFHYPQHIGVGQATNRLRVVQEAIRLYGAYERCPEAVKREWRYLLEYNRLDCEGLKYLMQQTVRISAKPRSAA